MGAVIAPTADQMIRLRAIAKKLLEKHVPYKAGDANYKMIVEATKWRKQKDNGTTCGFLCHWLMWRLGATRNPGKSLTTGKLVDVVNWNDTDRGCKYVNGANITKIHNGGSRPFVQVADPFMLPGKANPLMNLLEMGAMVGSGPKTGDIVFIREPGGPQHSEHVFVVREVKLDRPTLVWETSESGQDFGTDAIHKTRNVFLTGDFRAYTKLDGNTPQRTVIGWLDISQLDYDEDAVDKILNEMG